MKLPLQAPPLPAVEVSTPGLLPDVMVSSEGEMVPGNTSGFTVTWAAVEVTGVPPLLVVTTSYHVADVNAGGV